MDVQIEHYLIKAATRTREVAQVGPFTATFHASSTIPFLNYAVPIEGATPSQTDVAHLIDAYTRRSLTPRLEYLPSAAPEVEAALLAQGFVAEGRYPIMLYAPGTEQDVEEPGGIELLSPATKEEVFDLLSAQNEAYGADEPLEADVDARRKFLDAGGLAILARDGTSGEPVGGGICEVPQDGITELAAIGVRQPYRGRGIAGATIKRLAQEASHRGVTTVFLMATHDVERRIAERVGFSIVSEILHISYPLERGE